MIWTVIMVLLVLWLVGLLAGNTFGGILHLFFLVAFVIFVARLITGEKTV